jgi:hypothetical protein
MTKEPAVVQGTGYVLKKDGTRVPFEFKVPVNPEKKDGRDALDRRAQPDG